MTDDQVALDRDAMLIVMGEAMQAYASFEFWLFNLVDVLLKTRRESAAAIFYSIKNNRDRNAGVTALVRSVTGDRYVTFWTSMRKHIQKMDEMRNRLAHGLVILDVGKCSSKAPNHETGRLLDRGRAGGAIFDKGRCHLLFSKNRRSQGVGQAFRSVRTRQSTSSFNS
jgi:hypothetical protein